jgi:hypothetical protein
MSRTYKHAYHSNLFSNGERGHHNSLTREFRGIDGCWLVKSVRGLIDRRDYESDRNKGVRKIMTQKRRTVMKRADAKVIEEQLSE